MSTIWCLSGFINNDCVRMCISIILVYIPYIHAILSNMEVYVRAIYLLLCFYMAQRLSETNWLRIYSENAKFEMIFLAQTLLGRSWISLLRFLRQTFETISICFSWNASEHPLLRLLRKSFETISLFLFSWNAWERPWTPFLRLFRQTFETVYFFFLKCLRTFVNTAPYVSDKI